MKIDTLVKNIQLPKENEQWTDKNDHIISTVLTTFKVVVEKNNSIWVLYQKSRSGVPLIMRLDEWLDTKELCL
jgi:hypothetical protein